jgi:hypothetical protein
MKTMNAMITVEDKLQELHNQVLELTEKYQDIF